MAVSRRRPTALTVGLLLAVVIGAAALPSVFAEGLGIGHAGGVIAIATLGSVSGAILFGPRAGIGGSLAIGGLMALSVLTSASTLAAVVLMTGAGIAYALTATRRWHAGLALFPIALGFAISQPALPADPGSALVCGAATVGFGVIGTLAVLPFRSRLPATPGKAPLTMPRAVGYAGMLALATVVTTTLALTQGLGHVGGWLIMTPFIVIQPYVRDTWRMTARRVVGTLIGFALASVLGVLLADLWPVLHLIGIVFAVLMIWAKLTGKAYSLYATFVTMAVIILSSGGRGLQDIANHRLEATVGGVAISIAVIVLGRPLASWHQRRERSASHQL